MLGASAAFAQDLVNPELKENQERRERIQAMITKIDKEITELEKEKTAIIAKSKHLKSLNITHEGEREIAEHEIVKLTKELIKTNKLIEQLKERKSNIEQRL
jgi:DNA repair exonuclease SbcCD ATPase subunit